MKKEIDEIMLKNAIRLAIAGYLFDGGENCVEEVPRILVEMSEEYEEEINNKFLAIQLENEE